MVIVLFVSLFVFVGGKEASAHGAWAVIDADTGRLLNGSNENVRMPIASLTKIWTAFTVLESGGTAWNYNYFISGSFGRRFIDLFRTRGHCRRRRVIVRAIATFRQRRRIRACRACWMARLRAS